jgi:hypothetical protein
VLPQIGASPATITFKPRDIPDIMSEPRKQYSTPTVVTYGDIATLTQSAGALALPSGVANFVRWNDLARGGGFHPGEVCTMPYPNECVS